MLVTEEQAKEMWCPAVRIVSVDALPTTQMASTAGASWNRLHENKHPDAKIFTPHTAVCIGSRCMWWRWGSGWDNETKTYTTTYRKTPIKDSPGHFDNAPLGYCGTAGKPESA